MLTIGFGDITPQNPKEAIIVSLVEMFGVILFAFIINAVHTIMASIRDIKEKRERNLESVNRFMRAKPIDPDLQREVKKAVVNISDTLRIEELESEDKILNSIAPTLRERLLN